MRSIQFLFGKGLCGCGRNYWFSIILLRRNKLECFIKHKLFIVMSQLDQSSSWENKLAKLECPTLIDNSAVPFDWEKRWLKGHQYSHILANIDLYSKTFGFKKYQQKTHPKQIYAEPVNGMIYFVKGKGVGQDFGFPRMEQVKKKYRWKKMNFTTDLPKKNPYVTYVVASAMRAHLIEQNENAEFRMHAVIQYCEGRNASEHNEYILCHVRSVDHKKQPRDFNLRSCQLENRMDFYRLFAYMHNIYMGMHSQ